MRPAIQWKWKEAGTAFFGGPAMTGPFHGLQAEYARIPLASAGLVKLPETISDDEAILLSTSFLPDTSALTSRRLSLEIRLPFSGAVQSGCLPSPVQN